MVVPTLAGRRALVLGYGAIGSRCAKVLNALGMKVSAVRRTGSREGAWDGFATVHGPDALELLLPDTTALLICLPGTQATTGLLGRRQVRSLPKGAVLVNVGRGSIVDEDALFEALSDGHLGGAGLDVWYNYPMLPGQGGLGAGDSPNLCPASRPFWELPNVVMSPHRGQSSDTKARDRVEELLGMLRALRETGELPNRYDIGQGY